MNRVSSFVALAASALLLAGAAHAQSSAAPAGDSQLSDQVAAAVRHENPNLVFGLDVSTKDGVVTLSGQTRSAQDAMKALQAARRVPGVTKVVNRLSSAQ